MPSSLHVPILVVGMLVTVRSPLDLLILILIHHRALATPYGPSGRRVPSTFTPPPSLTPTQDMQCVENCSDPIPSTHVLYEQPVWQTLQMFLGEMLCFLPFLFTSLKRQSTSSVQLTHDHTPDQEEEPSNDNIKTFPDAGPQRLQGWKYLLLWFPAACDLTGTTLMNIGLLYTPVSIYQMTRGALVLFVGTFSIIFLRRRLWLYQWASLITVMLGVSLVGYSGSLIKDAVKEVTVVLFHYADATRVPPPPEPIEQPELTKVVVGVFFVLFAQVFTATQFIVEEKIMSRYTVSPDIAVGFEGLFGALTIVLSFPFIAMSPLADPTSPSYNPFFDLTRGWNQMIYTPAVLWSAVAIAISISLFNWFGLSVTKHLSATVRSLTDTCRTLSIWIVSLGLGWEKLLWPISLLQVVGFALVVYGTFLFNGLVKAPAFLPFLHHPASDAVASEVEEQEEESRHLLAEHTLDETAGLPADLGQSGFDIVPPPEQQQPKVRSD
ncbi:hypothetical protein EUX98_g350 [Antrodiella citrinella]|uniref:EamA domain-containing protein n=1 Tax=Antrodiella citrinella TaxID=2447956 RepID=A0A4S4N6A3_9APHY|nr:hypothetical protein EUX98_g350 [Antrodiella citrinella]